MNGIENMIVLLQDTVTSVTDDGLLRSFLSNGLLAGVGSVLVFLPQILLLVFFVTVLEDCGYLARAAFIMDRVFGIFGLQGRSFIPLLGSFACAIPGIMSARMIPSDKDRMATIMVAPLMTCSARIPVYTLIISAFIPDREVWGFIGLQGLVMFGLYAAGIVFALLLCSAGVRATPIPLKPRTQGGGVAPAPRTAVQRASGYMRADAYAPQPQLPPDAEAPPGSAV